MENIILDIWFWIGDRFPENFWTKPCKVCGFERQWHMYGLFRSGKVWVDGFGIVKCKEFERK